MTSRDGTGAKVSLGNGHELVLSRLNAVRESETAEIADGYDATVMVRPEHVEIGPPENAALDCTVRRIQFLGRFIRYISRCADASREKSALTPTFDPPSKNYSV